MTPTPKSGAAAAAAPSGPGAVRRGGLLLLVGAGVLLALVAISAGLLRTLWRMHGEWYGGGSA